MFANVLTREKVEFIESYDGAGIEKMEHLHNFQTPGTLKSLELWLLLYLYILLLSYSISSA